MSRISEFRPVSFWSGLLLKGKLPVQSLVRSLSLNNLISFTIIFSSVYLSLNKIVPLRIGKNSTPPDWQKQDPSGLAKTGPLRIGKNRTLPDWQNWDPSGLAKLVPLRIGKNRTPLDWQNWDPSGLGPLRVYKIAFQRLSKFSPDTLPDTFTDAIMLFELTRRMYFLPQTLPD